MTNIDTLTLSKVISLKGVYFLGYSWLFGMSVWITFFGGVIAFKTLPRQQFGALQHKTFPIYFVKSILLGSSLLGLWSYTHPAVQTLYMHPLVGDVAQAYALASVVLAQGLNFFVIGPLTSKTMFQRYKLEKEEKDSGKTSESDVSPQMKALNARFGMLHGVSSLANLGAVIALAFHGLWVGSVGV